MAHAVVLWSLLGLLVAGPAEAKAPPAQPGRPSPAAVIDVARPTGPISPYLYGQFIEHLGRSIHGGIWAEMIEDRKFYNPAGTPHSPWKKLGGEAGWSLTMDAQRPYVGAWSVKAVVTDHAGDELHGITQTGLGLVAGQEYAGHVVIAGAGTVEVILAWGAKPGERQTVTIDHLGPGFAAHPIRFKAGASTDHASLTIGLRRPGAVWIGTLSLMPAATSGGLRPDTLALLRQLDAPIYRWPGGNFASGYDWRDGIGPRDRRPPRKNPAWSGIEPNDFGIDEALMFCRVLKAEPLVVVNTGLGSPELAAALVEYCNGGPDTTWGRQRAANGHREPYRVGWWGIGNEMYGAWQLGHVPLDRYIARHTEFARAMRAVDPSIKLIGVGAVGSWSEQMLRRCGTTMTLISEHFYCGDTKPLEAHVAAIPAAVRRIAEAHRAYRRSIPGLAEHPIPVAIDEWNYWYGRYVYGELGTRYFLKDALGIARGLHEMVRQRDVIQMANYAQTVNALGCIKTTKTAAGFAATGLPLALYRQQFGTIAVDVQGHPEPLDVAAALTANRAELTIGVVNPTRKDVPLALVIHGATPARTARRFLITGPGPDAYNEPGKAPAVKIVERRQDFDPRRIAVPPVSIVLYRVPISKGLQRPAAAKTTAGWRKVE